MKRVAAVFGLNCRPLRQFFGKSLATRSFSGPYKFVTFAPEPKEDLVDSEYMEHLSVSGIAHAYAVMVSTQTTVLAAGTGL
jgi:hypothetical protein